MNAGTNPTQNPVAVLQIVITAAVAGVVAFTGVGIAIGPTLDEQDISSTIGILRIVCIATIAISVVLPPLIRSAVVKSAAGTSYGDIRERAGKAFLSATIISAAMAEGPALFGGIIVLLGGAGVSILLIAVPLALLILRFPTAGRYESFVRRVGDARSV